jgi:hypothetical protein
MINLTKKISILLQEDWNRANNRLKSNGVVSFVDKELQISALTEKFINIIKNNLKKQLPKTSFNEKKKFQFRN